MYFKIISIGTLKEDYLKKGVSEYQKRLSKYGKVDFIEIQESSRDNIAEEGLSILKRIKNDDFVIAMAIEGKQLNSVELATYIENTFTYKNSCINFIIGGSNGLDKSVLDRSDLKLSFSKLTFPHQLMKLILIEQIYRSVKIIKKEQYHK
ncbi:MAG: 23S rRNA (pseudouridine(1915)-N(3))-methyltransferase RlmH [Firmicutes bacterium]|nr:23S rRNA (pseudouridine(1915)-N(3))-methyltransferase RlmH [Bacillota bacterium]